MLILGVRMNIYLEDTIASEKQRRERETERVCVWSERERERQTACLRV